MFWHDVFERVDDDEVRRVSFEEGLYFIDDVIRLDEEVEFIELFLSDLQFIALFIEHGAYSESVVFSRDVQHSPFAILNGGYEEFFIVVHRTDCDGELSQERGLPAVAFSGKACDSEFWQHFVPEVWLFSILVVHEVRGFDGIALDESFVWLIEDSISFGVGVVVVGHGRDFLEVIKDWRMGLMGGMGVMGGDGRGVESAKVGRFMGWLQIFVKGMRGFRKRKGFERGDDH